MRYYLYVLSILWLGLGCNDLDTLQSIPDLDVNAEYALPLLDSRIEMRSLIDDFDDQATILVDDDGLLRFFYTGDTTIRDSREIFDQINAVLPPIIPIFDNPSGFSVANSSLDIDEVRFKAGRLEYTFFNANSNSVNVTVTVLGIEKNGEPLQQTHQLGAFENLPLQAFDMTDAVLIPQNDSFFVSYEAITAAGDLVGLEQFFMLPKEFDYSYAEGALGAQAFESPQDTLEIDYYSSWVGGNVFFQNPKVILNIDNSFGFPAVAMAERFEILTVDEQVLPLRSTLIDQGFAFNYPTFGEVGAVKETQFVFDTDNSNIAQVIGAGPTAVVYDLDVVTNPSANSKGFLTDQSYFAYSIDAEFPLEGNIRGFTVNDTSSVNFSDFGSVESIEFKIVTASTIPMETSLQLYFLDDKTQLLDSLGTESVTIIPAAETDNLGNVIEESESTAFVELDTAKFDRIRSARFLVTSTAFFSPAKGRQLARIKNDQGVDIGIGVKVRIGK
ncbi:MAG: hypothetical protein AAGI23_02730 [Bacteroidota bacterium]